MLALNGDKFFLIRIEDNHYCYNADTFDKIFEFSASEYCSTDSENYIYNDEDKIIYIYQEGAFKEKKNIEEFDLFETNGSFYMIGNEEEDCIILNKALDIVEEKVESCVMGNDFLFVEKDNKINVYNDKFIKSIEGYTLNVDKYQDADEKKYKTNADFVMLLKDNGFYVCDKSGNVSEDNKLETAKKNKYYNTRFLEQGTYTYYSSNEGCDVLILPNKEILKLGEYGFFESIADYWTGELCNKLFVVQNKETDEQFLVDKDFNVLEKNTDSLDMLTTYYKDVDLLIVNSNEKEICYNVDTLEKILETDKKVFYREEFKILELCDDNVYRSTNEFAIGKECKSIYSLTGKLLYEKVSN